MAKATYTNNPINKAIGSAAAIGFIIALFGAGGFLMILFNIVHPPAGGNPIIVIIGSASYDYLINPIIFGSIIILLLAILINKYLLKKNYPLK